MATIKTAYGASVDLTVTNLHSLASSQSWIAGWGSGVVDNSTDLDVDKLLSAKFTMASANNQAGQINVGIITMLDDSNWPAVSSGTVGTEGAIAFVDTEERDAIVVPLWSGAVDTSTAAVIVMAKRSVASLFGGVLPQKFVIFISGNGSTTTTAQFAASGNQVTVKGATYTVA